ncbi:MAG: YeeE/YedE family protein [Flavobacteriales bacterium]|nr:YeeE/YedE family protein [Bacteroidota bacterium]NCQ15182.1 YeeE/YedE family protein [Flavobacteriales bacterium]NCT16538.1 YeeE/YedE family protein [Flavobacteriales bacterium]
MIHYLANPWPWYIAGPLIGIMVPLLLLIGNKAFGISSNFRHICAMCIPSKIPYFNYDWKKEGKWQLILLLGIIIGGALAEYVGGTKGLVDISFQTRAWLLKMGIFSQNSLLPHNLFNWESLFTFKGFIMLVVGGFLVGFGTRYAGGCTSGHTITGISNLQIGSIIASIGFFIGGMITVYFIYPLIF